MKKMNQIPAGQDRIDEMLRGLPQIADKQLSDLTAGPHLKARILLAASETEKPRKRFSLPRWAPAALCGMAALVLVLAFGPMMDQQSGV